MTRIARITVPNRPFRYGLMSLDEMINCSVFGLATFCSQLMNELLQVVLHLRATENPYEPIPADKADDVRKWLSLWRTEAQAFEWDHVVGGIGRLEGKIAKGATYKDLEYGLSAIKDNLDDGLKIQLVYRYPNQMAEVLRNWQADWAPVLRCFGCARNDIRAGVDLWALEHHTASVFHMMRVLEIGLKALAAELGLQFTVQNWQNVINEIEAAIRQQQKSLPKGEAKADRLRFFSESAKEFMYFKDGWRNHVSHGRASYDRNEARIAMDHVRQFMTILATNLSVSVDEEALALPILR